jgi:hypothetical protein
VREFDSKVAAAPGDPREGAALRRRQAGDRSLVFGLDVVGGNQNGTSLRNCGAYLISFRGLGPA